MLRLQKYDVHIAYKHGKEILVPDALSRKPLAQGSDDLQESTEMQVQTVIRDLPVSDEKSERSKASHRMMKYCVNYKTQYYRDGQKNESSASR